MSENAHARLSPSSTDRWMECPGSIVLSQGIVDEGSEYAAEGTAAHYMAQMILEGQAHVDELIGRFAPNGVEMTEDMADHVMTYVTHVLEFAEGNTLMVEQRLSIEHLTQEPDAKGTSDAVIIAGEELQVHDLKFGRGVRVDADNNRQMMMYALGALREFEMIGPFKTVRLVIHQPRLNHISEWTLSVALLEVFADEVATAAESCKVAEQSVTMMTKEAWAERFLNPSDDACRWCKAKADCPKLRDFALSKLTGDDLIDYTQPLKPQVEATVNREFISNAELAECLSAVDLIESWCAAVRGKVNGELKAGRDVPGYKLVQGRKGARAWSSETEVEQIMKSMRLKVDEMYTMKIISPTQTEKLLAEKPKCWKRVEGFITQAEGGLSVAPLSDKRPAVVVSVEAFEDETAVEGLV